jgi:hypothetical protein
MHMLGSDDLCLPRLLSKHELFTALVAGTKHVNVQLLLRLALIIAMETLIAFFV